MFNQCMHNLSAIMDCIVNSCQGQAGKLWHFATRSSEYGTKNFQYKPPLNTVPTISLKNINLPLLELSNGLVQ